MDRNVKGQVAAATDDVEPDCTSIIEFLRPLIEFQMAAGINNPPCEIVSAMNISVVRRSLALVIVLASACAENTTGVCGQTVVDYCLDDDHKCPALWSQAQDPNYWGCFFGWLTLKQCGHAKIATLSGIDTGRDYTYDSDGKLVGIAGWGIFGDTCIAGVVPSSRCEDSTAERIYLCDRD